MHFPCGARWWWIFKLSPTLYFHINSGAEACISWNRGLLQDIMEEEEEWVDRMMAICLQHCAGRSVVQWSAKCSSCWNYSSWINTTCETPTLLTLSDSIRKTTHRCSCTRSNALLAACNNAGMGCCWVKWQRSAGGGGFNIYNAWPLCISSIIVKHLRIALFSSGCVLILSVSLSLSLPIEANKLVYHGKE